MMTENPVLLIDFGSTYTKVSAVDVSATRLLGTAESPTTAETDIVDGLKEALRLLEQRTGRLAFGRRLACSSAAGGLRMIACGLVPDLTAKAARLAALGAGAKLIKTYSYQLTEDDIEEIAGSKPDILLLTGGTDGGNSACILHNARMLAKLTWECPIVAAGNRSCGQEVMRILEGRRAYPCENVLPELGKLNIIPAQKRIRDIFLERIIEAKGLDRARELTGGILMPTPAAVLAAMELLSRGCDGRGGIGELMAVDLGGATTDVYSVAEGAPRTSHTIYKGLPEPYAKRTVEGDVGMRYSASGVVIAAGVDRVAELSGIEPRRVEELISRLEGDPGSLPDTREMSALDFALACLAIETAVDRHCGSLEEVYTASGPVWLQSGKDLTGVGRIVATGGALIHAGKPADIVSRALRATPGNRVLKPTNAEMLTDEKYILSSMGLLSEYEPAAALTIMKKELVSHGHTQQTDW